MTSQCDRILAVLADGEWHSVADIHAHAGYSRLNSRVAELRSRGHRIECDQHGEGDRATDRFRYRLLGDTPTSSIPDRQQGSAGLGDDGAAWGVAEQPDGQTFLEVAA